MIISKHIFAFDTVPDDSFNRYLLFLLCILDDITYYRFLQKKKGIKPQLHVFTVLAPVELGFIPNLLVGQVGVNRDESG